MGNLLWVTSFNQALFETSGMVLLDSFVRHSADGEILVMHEDFEWLVEGTPREVIPVDINEEPFLKDWLTDNSDVIPTHYGGKASQCDCPNGGNLTPSTKHISKVCHWTWWNRNCSRWFRKVAALKYAFDNFPHRFIVWIDCDCIFTAGVPLQWLENYVFQASPIFLLMGPKRSVPETGLVGYDRGRDGEKVFREMERLYVSKQYRSFERWDDSFMFQEALRRTPHVTAIDIVPRHTRLRTGHVVQYSVLGKRIVHNKGHHSRVPGLTDAI